MSRSHLVRPVLAGFAALSFAAAGAASDARAHDLTLSAAWTRSTPPGAEAGAGYLTIFNRGGRPDRLIGGSSSAAREVQVHEMRIAGGIARMHPVEGGLAIPAGGSVTLAPGGYHLMLIGLKHPLKVCQHVPATLRFERAGSVKVSFVVSATAPVSAGTR